MSATSPGKPALSTRLRITGILAGMGGLFGAAGGAVLTFLGNLISGYPVAPGLEVYLNNAGILGAIGAVSGPTVAWSLLRRVPLWRALAEPAAVALVAGIGSMLLAPSLFLPAVVVGGLGGAVRLHFAYDRPGSRVGAGEAREELGGGRG